MSYIQPASAGRRSVGITIVVVFHIVLFYALVSGLARKVVEVVKAPLETKIIEEVKPPEEAPPRRRRRSSHRPRRPSSRRRKCACKTRRRQPRRSRP